MSQVQPTRFKCIVCGKQYVWKPELAGRKVMCRCGQPIQVPTATGAKAPVLQPATSELPATERAVAHAAAGAARPAAKVEEPQDEYELADDPQPARKPAAASTAPAKEPCPNCGLPVSSSADVCVECGFDLKQARQRAAAAAPLPAAAAQGFAAIPRRPAAPAGPPVDRPLKQLAKYLIPLGALTLVVLAVVGFKVLSGKSRGKGGPTLPGQDATVLAAIKDDGAAELVQWINADPNRRMVKGMTRERAIKFAERMKDLGARQTLSSGGSPATWLAIELPPEPAKRTALFDWVNRWHKEMKDMSVKEVRDEGQKYLIIQMRVAAG